MKPKIKLYWSKEFGVSYWSIENYVDWTEYTDEWFLAAEKFCDYLNEVWRIYGN